MAGIEKLKNLFRSVGVDKPINISVFTLAIFGIFMIGSASIGSVTVHGATYAMKNMFMQSAYVLAGTMAMIFITRVFKTRYLNSKRVMQLYFFGLGLMILCRAFSSSKGSYAWIKFGTLFSIQPAEFMKIFMILILSYLLTESDKAFIVKGKFRTQKLKEEFYKRKLYACVGVPLLLVGIVGAVGLLVQKDFGTTMILMAICFICFMVTPREYYKKYKILAWILIGIGAVGLLIVGTFLLQGYQLARISSWLDPLVDPYGVSMQLSNALIAFNNGGVFGLGFGKSTQKFGYIPESQNDFIGAIIYEELGILGLALIIIPTCIIIFRLLKYAAEVKENKSKIILVGISSYFFLHLLINLGGVSGFIPMTGVPLLLISAGGSSTVSAFISIGIAQSIIARHNRQKFDTD